MLNITNLTKSYANNAVKAVDGLSLTLQKGEIFGFLGPNGAGKTTTIKALTGILPFDEGQITIDGIDVKKNPTSAKQNIGYVSDNHVIYDKLSGREYVNFLADVFGVGKDERELVKEMVDKFGLTDAYNSQIKTYSHGMKQKISVIGALVHSPKLWVLDEPLTGLDPQSAFELKSLMRLHCDRGNTVFFSTHILEVAEKLCDRVGIIVKGKLAAIGTPDQIAKSQGKTLEEVFLELTKN
ncbi:MAG: ABC transporter ATP-binding protein [Firmicutes bacterium]|nr:ABC transporter ATP-binding protein [Bacillota bacterium]